MITTVQPLPETFVLETIPDVYLDAGESSGALSFTLGALAYTGLTVRAFTDNPSLFPEGSLVLSTTAANMTLIATPAADVRGMATVFVSAGRNGKGAVISFRVFVGTEETHTAPVVSAMQDTQAIAGTVVGPFDFTATGTGTLSLEAVAVDNEVVADAGFQIIGNQLSIRATTPGTTQAFLFAVSGGVRGSSSFSIDAVAEGEPTLPVISEVDNIIAPEVGTYGPFEFTLGSLEFDPDTLSVEVSSDNQDAVPDDSISISGAGDTRYLTIRTRRPLQKAVVLEEYEDLPYRYEDVPSEDDSSRVHGIPKGYMMVFAHGRLHMVPSVVPGTDTPGRPFLLSGDILQPWDPGTVLDFTETNYLAEGGAHGLPSELGNIGGLGVLRNTGSASGTGAVIVLARNGVCAFEFSLPRAYWNSQQISSVLFFGSGCVSPWSVINVNGDLIYRSQDGLRTLKYTASQASGSSGTLANLPMSTAVESWMLGYNEVLPYVSTAFADNRLLLTAAGTGERSFRGVVSWDLFSGVGVYDGLWTGDTFSQVVTAMRAGKPTGYIFSEGPRLYRVDEDAVYDYAALPKSADDEGYLDAATEGHTPVRITSRLETKALTFGDYTTRKRLMHADLWLANIVHEVDLKLWYRPHGYPKWFPMGERTISVPEGTLPQYHPKVRISLDNFTDFCDPSTGDSPHTATTFQLAVEWTGQVTIERCSVAAVPVMEAPPEPCFAESGMLSAADSTSGDELDDFSYQIRE